MLPLTGITVVALEHAVAAPFATRQLADLGARVIKIERPGGGDFARRYDESIKGQSSYFVWLNRSKESVTLDVKSEPGRAILHELVGRADVLVQNLGPGAAARLGLSPEAVLARDPSKIVVGITGWGGDGPWAHRKAYDLLVQCETGLVSLTGSPDEPARVGISVADIAAGMYAFSAVLAALYRRRLTGEGAALEISLLDALGEWMGQPAHYTEGTGTQQPRAGARHATIAPYGPYTTRDGRTILISIQNEPEWTRFCADFLAQPDLATDPRFATNPLRVANRDALEEIVAARFAELDASEATSLLDQAGIANAGVNTVADFLDHPVLRARDRWREVATPNGPIRALLPPITFAGLEPRMDPIPAVGEHTAAVLAELGRTPEEIADLARRKVI
ncbi:CoA transferase [Thermopolyspora flexuosa]|uniref:Crotonobetainyl-CoA:carnitine CoA-transferase CaiB-like acyl-CoA transferase n=1 Tax=Thermopolyspora flexuosa TaxID=103836 RepID=A0A543ISC1_9ACTN|nr:CaiB/BaiF CoA-transferase family protein [Thermopolyspora flexuosa]TQM73479.1 crotonobetainyl-CoA:carnitine CoA-transferase CaiB-like acyl-CoA transferase [Thermopolyspora flexuosa]GGM81523.1 CoA transferase [Thermopolyspora flexuosa]